MTTRGTRTSCERFPMLYRLVVVELASVPLFNRYSRSKLMM